MITISKTHLTEIHNHAKDTYPHECCGAILGSLDTETGDKIISAISQMDNSSEENKKQRFMIKPQEYQRVEQEAKEKDLQLLGFYHSHPDHPASPSETDLKHAWPFFSYIILSIEKSVPAEISSHVLSLETQQFEKEELRIN